MEANDKRRHRKVNLRDIYRRYGGIFNDLSIKEAEICMGCPFADCKYQKNKCPTYRAKFAALAESNGLTKTQLDILLSRLQQAIMVHYVNIDRGTREETPTYSDGLSGSDRKSRRRGRPKGGE